MSAELLRAIERAHAVSAWLATAALIVTLWFAWRGAVARWVTWLTATTTGLLLALTTGLGFALHDPYRAQLRQRLFLDSASLGWLFERKQHVAFGALMLSIGALASLALLRRAEARGGDAGLARDLRRAVAIGWTAAALLALFASVASALVARSAAF